MAYSRLIYGIVMLLVSCDNNDAASKSNNDTTTIDINNSALATVTCYTAIAGKDSFFLKTEATADLVTGALQYNFFEKDDNNGQINGKLNGDTLLAVYTFMSEGKPSVRQVAFLIADSTATEGYGPMTEQEDQMLFTLPGEIDFSRGTRFVKTPCTVED